MNITRQSAPRMASAVWGVGLVLSGFDLSVPPARIPIFIRLACIAVIPLILGSRPYRIFGIIAVAGSLMLAYWEYEAGLRVRTRIERLKHAIQAVQPTNTPVPIQQNQP